MSSTSQLPASEPLSLDSLIMPTAQGISSRILGKAAGGSMTLFAFDEGQGLTEHTSPFDAYVLILSGALEVTIGGRPARVTSGSIVRMPADIPHALEAPESCRMLLIMLK